MRSDTYIYVVKGIGLSTRKDPRTGKQRKPQTLLIAARHNLREIQAENGAGRGKIDISRIRLNEVLEGPKTAIEVQAAADRMFKMAGIDQANLRKDHSQASEHVLSLSDGQSERGFFPLVVDCFRGIYGPESILSAVIHRDEAQPHIHILVSPISGGINMGSSLHNQAALKSNRNKLAAALQKIGFKPPLIVKKQNTPEKAVVVLAHLEHIQHPIIFDSLWPALVETINHNPHHLFEHFKLDNIATPNATSQARLRKQRTFIEDTQNIGIDRTEPTTRYLTSVGIGTSVLPSIPQFSRLRDVDLSPEAFDCETGEFNQR